jgi:AraC-like DNA-binding protein
MDSRFNGHGAGTKGSNARPGSEPTFRVGPLVNLADLVRSFDCDPVTVFGAAGFKPEEFTDPNMRIPYIKGSQLLAHCVETIRCEHLGLLLGQMAEPSLLGLVGFILNTAQTVEEALRSLVANLDLHDEGATCSLNIGPSHTSLEFALQIPGVAATAQIYDLSATIMYKIMLGLCGPNWAPTAIRLGRRKPYDVTPYRQYFGTTLLFDLPNCAVTFENKYLQQQPPAADKLLHQHLDEEARMQHELQQRGLAGDLPAALRRGILAHNFSAHHIASNLGLHERTLHRRLKLTGTSFRKELDLARRAVSEQLLGGTSLPVSDIASTLGYSDSSGFIRAFQRWYGTSPSSWRKQNS